MRRNLPTAIGFAALWSCTACVDYGMSDDDDQADERLVIEESFTQQAAPTVDVLWVVDNTGSMAREQQALASSFEAFVQALDAEGVSYQLGVITTDVSDEQAGLLQGVPWIVTPGQDDPVESFTQAVQVGIDGASPEAGLAAAVLALSEPAISEHNRGFRRPDTLLHVVAVSDNDDQSDGHLSGDTGQDVVDVFLDFFEAQAEVSGIDPIFSAVAGDTPSGCVGDAGRALPAQRYQEVVDATGGTFASICTGDMDAVVQGLGTASLVYPDTFTLQARPYLDTLVVWVDGERQDVGWSWQEESMAVVFEAPPPAGCSIRVRYTVDESQGDD